MYRKDAQTILYGTRYDIQVLIYLVQNCCLLLQEKLSNYGDRCIQCFSLMSVAACDGSIIPRNVPVALRIDFSKVKDLLEITSAPQTIKLFPD